jgi:ABC-type branched-subunit amino acid transport system ATPase component
MILFILALNPLLIRLDRNLAGMQINQTQQKTSVIAYVEDVTIILTDPSDIRNVEHILTQYMKTSGARINVNKSIAINMGGWDTTR